MERQTTVCVFDKLKPLKDLPKKMEWKPANNNEKHTKLNGNRTANHK